MRLPIPCCLYVAVAGYCGGFCFVFWGIDILQTDQEVFFLFFFFNHNLALGAARPQTASECSCKHCRPGSILMSLSIAVQFNSFFFLKEIWPIPLLLQGKGLLLSSWWGGLLPLHHQVGWHWPCGWLPGPDPSSPCSCRSRARCCSGWPWHSCWWWSPCWPVGGDWLSHLMTTTPLPSPASSTPTILR